MSTYENSGPGGVGKRYGALGLGGMGGITRGNNGDHYLDFEASVTEIEPLNAQVHKLPTSYGVIRRVEIEVQEAFTSGTVDIVYDAVKKYL